jgi:hypothetical protein
MRRQDTPDETLWEETEELTRFDVFTAALLRILNLWEV